MELLVEELGEREVEEQVEVEAELEEAREVAVKNCRSWNGYILKTCTVHEYAYLHWKYENNKLGH